MSEPTKAHHNEAVLIWNTIVAGGTIQTLAQALADAESRGELRASERQGGDPIQYYDIGGDPCSLDALCRKEPEWAASRIRHMASQPAPVADAEVANYRGPPWSRARNSRGWRRGPLPRTGATAATPAGKLPDAVSPMRPAGSRGEQP